ncbi:hypothetical protein HNR46_003795 [Haloferula luteola]|uniref:DUF2288 domain-containing protein n=1 Tax=Haloferula luteola TaxID=595692 RepID=A0A840VDE8_9BACT|nr:DUF2288 domain-containing protein [Haloferula luteola]MBB5353534.1 hypothetical protein [Haloferula luteola]
MSDEGRMKYGILGEDRQSDDEKISKYTGEVAWSYLRPHFQRDALLWVDPELNLEEVAKAFTDDDTSRVANWLGNGDLVRVGQLHAAQWEDGEELFTAVVVTPFVLMQPCVG